MKAFAASFYRSAAWQKCRAAYIQSVGGLCERCLARGQYRAGVIVHHKQYITPETIQDERVLLNQANLELLCRVCHADEHTRLRRRYSIDQDGRVWIPPHTPKDGAVS